MPVGGELQKLNLFQFSSLNHSLDLLIRQLQVPISADFGADTKIRTRDLLITNQLLYQLSYAGAGAIIETGRRGSKLLNVL